MKLFQGKLTPLSAAGVYARNGVGSVTLYPAVGHYIGIIQTAEPTSGRWTCEVFGKAVQNGQLIQFTTERGETFPVHFSESGTLIIENGDELQSATERLCGLNGTIAFYYKRQK